MALFPMSKKGDDCKDAAFRYLHKGTPCVCLGEQYIDGLIKHLNISGYQAGDFIQHCAEYNILKDGQRSITVKSTENPADSQQLIFLRCNQFWHYRRW